MDDNYSRDKDGFIILEPAHSKLYQKSNYTIPVQLIINRIYEYDIQTANAVMLRKSGKVDDEIIDEMLDLYKGSRERLVGKMIRQNRKFYEIISRGIQKSRHQLFQLNHIQDHEVLSIKNDAVFIVGRRLKHTKFDGVNFRLKNQYGLFLQFKGLEFYYSSKDKRIDIKGINDAVVNDPDHQKGMVQFLITVFNFLVYDRRQELRDYLNQFSQEYKEKKLPIEYYKEFSRNNHYRTNLSISEMSFHLLTAGKDEMDILDIAYNYNRFVLPLINQFI